MSDDPDLSAEELIVTDAPEGFTVPDPAAAPDDAPTPEPVTSGAGVTSLLDRARTNRKGGRPLPTDPTAGRQTKKKDDRPAPPIPRGGFAPSITKMYQTLGALVLPFNPAVGSTLIQIAPEAAKALDELARTNIAFRRFLVAMTTTTTLGAVIAAHAPLIAVIVSQAMNGNPAMAQMSSLFAVPDEGEDTPS